jgi:hypothetical protein
MAESASHTQLFNANPAIDHSGVHWLHYFGRYFFEGGVHSHQLLRGAREETLLSFLVISADNGVAVHLYVRKR